MKNMKKFLKSTIAFVCTLAMIATSLGGGPVTIYADATPASYYDRDAKEVKTVSAELVTSDSKNWDGATEWYVVKDTITISERITVTGDVHLILADGAELKAEKGINVSDENALTIYGQTDEVTADTGKIEANGVSMSGIGGTDYGSACGKITITGGVVDAKSIYDGAGIGGGSGVDGGIITITGGTVTATSVNGAGIGGGANGSIGATLKGGAITISGGTVTAKSESGAGIGGGKDYTKGAAHGGTTGGTITINGGTVTASSMIGAGIGGGAYGKAGNVTIIDGTVTASSGGGAGIGGGLEGAGETTEISGGTVEAISIDGAGIGGGYKGSGGKITISGGTVKAIAKDYGDGNGAGIGGGKKGSGGNITISGGTVNALVYSYGNNSGAGIGGGYGADGGNITISGGTVLGATAGDGAGIGGGGADKESKNAGDGGKITITGGKVLANSTFGHGIGGGISKESGGQNGANGSFSTGADGKAMIISKSIADKNDQASWQGIIFEVPNGKVYGNQELNEDFEIKEGQTLTIPAGITLTIHSGKTLIIKGTVRNFGTINGNVQIVENGKLLEPHPAPNVVIDYRAEKLTGFNRDISYEITLNGGNGETINKPNDGKADINTAWFGKTLSIMAKEDDNHLDGIIQNIDIPNHPDAPTGLEGVSETVSGKNDGKITGTTAGMEYKLSSENNWKPCATNEISNLAPGEYEVRIAAADSNFVGEVAIVKVKHAVPFTAPKAKLGLSYTGNEQELIDAGIVELGIGSFMYSLSEAGEYKAEIPKGRNAGSYEVYYKVVGTNIVYDYTNAKGKVVVTIAKANQAALAITEVSGKKFGDGDFSLATTGGSGGGAVSYSVPANNGVLSITGDTAEIIGAGKVTVTAIKAGDDTYEEARAEREITISKGDAPDITFPTAGDLTYGQKLSESTLTGGSEKYGTFTWKDGNVIPTVVNSGYEVVFTPNADTIKNHEMPANITKTINITVAKKKLVVKAENKRVIKGSAMPTFTHAAEGLVNGDIFANPVFVPSTTDTNTIGEYEITVSGGTLTNVAGADAQNNYEITYQKGTLTIAQSGGSPGIGGAGGSGGGGGGSGGSSGGDAGSTTPSDGKDTDISKPGDAADNKAKFTDVKDSDYFAKAVAWAVEKGITTGTTPTTFSPNAPCTRAQIVTFLWRAAGKPEPQKTDNPFADVKADAYYNKALLWAVEQGIVKGTSATAFSPDATCTRGQMAAILYRYAKSPDVKGDKSFADVKADAYYANAVKWAAEQGITEGTGATSFSPDATCTRAQIVTFLYRYMIK